MLNVAEIVIVDVVLSNLFTLSYVYTIYTCVMQFVVYVDTCILGREVVTLGEFDLPKIVETILNMDVVLSNLFTLSYVHMMYTCVMQFFLWLTLVCSVVKL